MMSVHASMGPGTNVYPCISGFLRDVGVDADTQHTEAAATAVIVVPVQAEH